MWKMLRPNRANLAIWQWLLLVLCFVLWYVLTSPTLLPAFYFDDPNKAAFLFGEPQKVLVRIWQWFTSGEIYIHLWVTLVETVRVMISDDHGHMKSVLSGGATAHVARGSSRRLPMYRRDALEQAIDGLAPAILSHLVPPAQRPTS